MPSRFQKLKKPPAKFELSRMASKPRAVPSRGLSSPDAQKNDTRKRIQSRSQRQLRRRHLRVDIGAPARDRILRIVAQHLVERVRQIQPPDVPVAGQPVIIRPNLVRLRQADRRRPHQEIVGVVLQRRIVLVVMKAHLDRYSRA